MKYRKMQMAGPWNPNSYTPSNKMFKQPALNNPFIKFPSYDDSSMIPVEDNPVIKFPSYPNNEDPGEKPPFDIQEEKVKESVYNPYWKKTKDPVLQEKQPEKIDPFFTMRGFATGASWLSGMVDRGRQNQYMYNQYSTLGQNTPANLDDSQPNPYNLYAEKGGKINRLSPDQYLKQRGLVDADDKGDFDNISPNQAREILHAKKINGKELTDEQRRLFGFLSKGNTKKYQVGGIIDCPRPFSNSGGGYTSSEGMSKKEERKYYDSGAWIQDHVNFLNGPGAVDNPYYPTHSFDPNFQKTSILDPQIEGSAIDYRPQNGYAEKGGKVKKLSPDQYLRQRGLVDADDKGDFDNISPNQAREILHAKKINGKELTDEQRRLFGFLSKGNTKKYQVGGVLQSLPIDKDIFNDKSPKWEKKLYEPTNMVKRAKAFLSGADLASTPFAGTPIGAVINRGASIANSVGDAYTAARYAMDGQWKNAGIDAGEALLDLIPFKKGKVNNILSKAGRAPYLNTLTKTDKFINNSLKTAKGVVYADDFQDVINSDNVKYQGGGMIKRADGSYSKRGLWDNYDEWEIIK